jgi:hypothetical protein
MQLPTHRVMHVHPAHEPSQLSWQVASSQVLAQVAGQVAAHVGHPGHVQLVGQVHSCSATTVPFSRRTSQVSKLSTARSSNRSFFMVPPRMWMVDRDRTHGKHAAGADE